MNNLEHLEILASGDEAIRKWRKKNRYEIFNLEGVKASGLTFADINDAQFLVNFKDADLSSCCFKNVALIGANFAGADLTSCSFTDCHLAFSDFENAKLHSTSFNNCDLTNASMVGAQIQDTVFEKAILNRISLPDDFSSVDLIGCSIQYRGNIPTQIFRKTVIFRYPFLMYEDLLETIKHRQKTGKHMSPLRQFGKGVSMSFKIYAMLLAPISWAFVRVLGSIKFLTKASYISLVAIPVIAWFWPALRSAVSFYKNKFDISHQKLESILAEAANVSHSEERISDIVDQLTLVSQNYSASYGFIEPINLPTSMAAAYFASLCVVIGHLIFELRASQIIKDMSKKYFKDNKLSEYRKLGAGKEIRILECVADINKNADAIPNLFHGNLIKYANEVVWIPSNFHNYDWPDQKHKNKMEYALIEYSAECNYDVEANSRPLSALMCVLLYISAMFLITSIVWMQSINIINESGFHL